MAASDQQQRMQQENVAVGDHENVLNNRQPVRRRGGIAKALQYGNAAGESSDEASNNMNRSVPLYR